MRNAISTLVEGSAAVTCASTSTTTAGYRQKIIGTQQGRGRTSTTATA
jgi:hypothetical protein